MYRSGGRNQICTKNSRWSYNGNWGMWIQLYLYCKSAFPKVIFREIFRWTVHKLHIHNHRVIELWNSSFGLAVIQEKRKELESQNADRNADFHSNRNIGESGGSTAGILSEEYPNQTRSMETPAWNVCGIRRHSGDEGVEYSCTHPAVTWNCQRKKHWIKVHARTQNAVDMPWALCSS